MGNAQFFRVFSGPQLQLTRARDDSDEESGSDV